MSYARLDQLNKQYTVLRNEHESLLKDHARLQEDYRMACQRIALLMSLRENGE